MKKSPTIQDKIRLIRVNLGWTQKDLANHLEKTVAMVSKYENGLSIPPGNVLDKIYALKAKIKNVTLEF